MSHEIQRKIENFHEHLVKWRATKGINVINPVPILNLITGETDDLCFCMEKENALLTLNRVGAVKLLSTTDKQSPGFKLCSEWNTVETNTSIPYTGTQNRNAYTKHY